MTYLAHNVTIDHVHHQVIIDGYVIPWFLSPDMEIDSEPLALTTVRLGVYTEAAHVYRSLEADLRYIRDLADQHRRDLGLEVPSRG